MELFSDIFNLHHHYELYLFSSELFFLLSRLLLLSLCHAMPCPVPISHLNLSFYCQPNENHTPHTTHSFSPKNECQLVKIINKSL